MQRTQTPKERDDEMTRVGLILLTGPVVAAALLDSNRTTSGAGMAFVVFLLAVAAPPDKLRHHMSFAGHQVPAAAIFLLGLGVALAALCIALIP